MSLDKSAVVVTNHVFQNRYEQKQYEQKQQNIEINRIQNIEYRNNRIQNIEYRNIEQKQFEQKNVNSIFHSKYEYSFAHKQGNQLMILSKHVYYTFALKNIINFSVDGKGDTK